MLDQKELKNLVTYNPNTGLMIWKKRDCKMFKSDGLCRRWNKRYANKQIDNIDSQGYVRACIHGKRYNVHRLAWLYVYGELPNIIDHINGIKTDNRIDNLRNTTVQGNGMNRKKQINNTSGVTGVTIIKLTNKYKSEIKYKNKLYKLGTFSNFFDAVCARKSAENKFGFICRDK